MISDTQRAVSCVCPPVQRMHCRRPALCPAVRLSVCLRVSAARACGQYGEQSARVNRASTADRQTDAQTERQTTHTERETHTERASASGNVLCSDCTVSVVRSQCYHAMTMTMTRPTPTCTHTSAIDRLSLSLSLCVCGDGGSVAVPAGRPCRAVAR